MALTPSNTKLSDVLIMIKSYFIANVTIFSQFQASFIEFMDGEPIIVEIW